MIAPTAAHLAAWRGRRVLLTGHTGFKGSWLAIWLHRLGAEVTGFALPPEPGPGIFVDAGVASTCRHLEGDVRDPAALAAAVREARPDAVFHLAAQALVRRAYGDPAATWDVNVMGTVHLLETLRAAGRPCAVVVVTSDKCYENREWVFGYREEDSLGGHDPYSSSKGAAELVTSSWRRSYFPADRIEAHGIALASARAGNVIGGGDWSADRIVPDAVRALSAGRAVPVRNPRAVRPWQHVLDPLGGYLALAGALLDPERRARAAEAWNFGPTPSATMSVAEVVDRIVAAWGEGRWEATPLTDAPHEAGLLRLAIDKACSRLGWAPRWGIDEAVGRTIEFYRAERSGGGAAALRALAEAQIAAWQAAEGRA